MTDFAEFRERGFVRLAGVLPPAELEALRAETQAHLEAGPDRDPAADFVRRDGRWWRVNSMITKPMENRSVLAAIVNPGIGTVLDALLDRPVFSDDALVFKWRDGGAAVPVHTAHASCGGVPWSPEREIVNVGVYLDDATPATGCLRVVPGSHHLAPDEAADLLARGLDAPGMVDVPMQAGDVLLHSEWIVHGSAATEPGGALRRVLYLAFKGLDEMTSIAGEDGVAVLLRRMELAARVRAAAGYGDEPGWFAMPPEWRARVDAVSDGDLAAAAPEVGQGAGSVAVPVGAGGGR